MDFLRLAKVEDFDDSKVRSYSIMGRKIAVIKKDDGSFHAIEASCKHQGADLTTGKIEGMVATCPRHQWQYDLETGQCLNHDSLPLKKYGIRVDGEDILVSYLPLSDD